jgi:hypothetical protein
VPARPASHFQPQPPLSQLLAMSSLLGTSNYSFYAIPVAWAVAIAPHFYAVSLFDSSRIGGANKVSRCLSACLAPGAAAHTASHLARSDLARSGTMRSRARRSPTSRTRRRIPPARPSTSGPSRLSRTALVRPPGLPAASSLGRLPAGAHQLTLAELFAYREPCPLRRRHRTVASSESWLGGAAPYEPLADRLSLLVASPRQLAGNVARLPVDTLNSFAAIYLGSRVVYNILYISISDGKLAHLRSVSYLAGIGAIFRIFIKAGNAFR